VPAAQVARAQPEDFRIDDLAAVEHQQPVRRAHELGFAGAPAHPPRDRQRLERRLHDPGQ
jgi:hypothetical protein